jgi:tRNA(Ile)-lysidine synthase
MNLIKKIQENIFRYQLFQRGAKIIVAVSGGPDSVCLLDVLSTLRKKYNILIIVAHVNYGLRGKDSDLDEKIARKLAQNFSLPIEVLKYRPGKGVANSEEKLRNIRYDFFEKLGKKHKAGAIAVGHNLNDQAETVIMRIVRGTGLRGLGAIRFRNGNIIRPLLNIDRKTILKYLRDKKLRWRIDKTNLGADFTRNKIRNKIFTYLEKKINPNIQESLFNLSQSVADDYDFISLFASDWLKQNKKLSVSKIIRIHPSLQREVLRQKIEKLVPYLRGVETVHMDEILKIIKSDKSKNQKFRLKDLRVSRNGDKLTISNK